eukprot:TRINITY_DN10859_c0_g1_i2.p1 TRINITY_DN10859_c0_g1~~TRINITY_DN10859_c0_g1_i2.p1  ORF type:complete len:320 (+),score=74.08 TRINITY_DN10859_c0_g1_i2:75-1034(+)
MDINDRRTLSTLIEKVTKPGRLDVAKNKLAEIKEIVRKSNENVKTAYDFLTQQLKSNNSQSRYLSMLVIDDLFLRSKYFRQLVTNDFKEFLELSIGTHRPLPQPAESATLLREKSLAIVENWCKLHGEHNKQLMLGYNYLKYTMKMKFPDIQSANNQREQQRLEQEARAQNILGVKFNRTNSEMNEMLPEIQNLLDQMEGGFDILIPSLEEGNTEPERKRRKIADEMADLFGEDDDEEQQETSVNRIVDEHGLGSTQYELKVQISGNYQNKRNEDNSAVVETIRDALKILLHKYEPIVKDWQDTLIKVETPVKICRGRC